MNRSSLKPKFQLDRYTQIGELTEHVRNILDRVRAPLVILLAAETIFLFATGRPGGTAFALIAIGTVIPLEVWRARGIGLPLLPMLVLQYLALYGLPIVAGHDEISDYTADELNHAGLEVLICGIAMAAAWRLGMQIMTTAKAICYALPEVNRDGLKALSRLGFSLVAGATAYLLLRSLGLLEFVIDMLPAGSTPIIFAVNSACGVCGFFLLAMAIGSNGLAHRQRLIFWIALALNSAISAGGLILSSPAVILFAVAVGLFWGSGRVPWRYLVITISVLAFLNIGKFAMRDRYWSADEDSDAPQLDLSLSHMPSEYLEWFQTSLDMISFDKDAATLSPGQEKAKAEEAQKQSLIDRIDNLQNLLFAIHAVQAQGVAPLWGETYKVIPFLLIPRILWPTKPRTHEGQIMLNVHFGRQDLFSTLRTYVAWGLLPEAYGNFGPITGSFLIGAVLGLAFAWFENFTARKLVVSLEGFVAFDVLINMMNSYEMVASVFVTSTFQSVVPIAIACMPFVRRMAVSRPHPENEEAQDPVLESQPAEPPPHEEPPA